MKRPNTLALAIFVLLMFSPVIKAARHNHHHKKGCEVGTPPALPPSVSLPPVPSPAEPPLVTVPFSPTFPPATIPSLSPVDPPLAIAPSLPFPPLPLSGEVPPYYPPPSNEVPPYDPPYSYGVPAVAFPPGYVPNPPPSEMILAPSPDFPPIPWTNHVFVSSCEEIDCGIICMAYFFSNSESCGTYQGYHFCDCP